MDPPEKINPYAPSSIEDSVAAPPIVEYDSVRWFNRVLWGNYVLLLGSFAAGIAAMITIFSIVFSSMLLTPLCILLVSLVFFKQLPRKLTFIPFVLLLFMGMVFVTINRLNLSPTRAEMPVGCACLGMGMTLQLGWALILRVKNHERLTWFEESNVRMDRSDYGRL